jgi:hypothetical protein
MAGAPPFHPEKGVVVVIAAEKTSLSSLRSLRLFLLHHSEIREAVSSPINGDHEQEYDHEHDPPLTGNQLNSLSISRPASET